jgi:putative PIN family toxin of toxin-antitoxin system
VAGPGRGNQALGIDLLDGIVYDTMMDGPQIVIDTSVLVSALRSKRGASHLLLRSVDSGKFEVHLSVPLFLEYEEVCKRLIGVTPLTEEDIDAILDYLCKVAHHHRVFYLWRPFLKDSKDDMVLELAVAAGCDSIVTCNVRDFQGSDQFGIQVLTPKEFLQQIGELP